MATYYQGTVRHDDYRHKKKTHVITVKVVLAGAGVTE